MLEFYDKLQELLAGNVPFVSVTIVDTIGSVPQNAGSKMLVTADGLHYGTVGGGKVEKRAIEEAQAFLGTATEMPAPCSSSDQSSSGAGTSGAAGEPCGAGDDDHANSIRVGEARTRFVNWSLDKDIGMTCGGSTKLYFEVFNTHQWHIVVFGAGHCSNALIDLLEKLDCRITCYDSRQEWLDRLPVSPKLKKVRCDELPQVVSQVPGHSFVILMTMGHTTDKPILLEILKGWDRKPFPYLGVIGSKAKAVRLRKDIAEAGLPKQYENLFCCPMGLPIGNNHPQEIAISIVSQLLQERDKLSS